jgi:hypothetical protein
MINLVIEHCETTDMPDGQCLPPYMDNGAMWHVVCRLNNKTLWRRIILKDKSTATATRRIGGFS